MLHDHRQTGRIHAPIESCRPEALTPRSMQCVLASPDLQSWHRRQDWNKQVNEGLKFQGKWWCRLAHREKQLTD
jgi:hypothetical protein